MSEVTFGILVSALILDWYFGEPTLIWSRVPHPIVLFGKMVSLAERSLNLEGDADSVRFRKGGLAIGALIILAFLCGLGLQWVAQTIGVTGHLVELFIVFVLIAQRSLYDHVSAVESGLRDGGIEAGRRAVGMIVGRDPETLDASGVSRASIESLAENFSDGVVAPVFWYAVFGLPGIIVYKMINTADSMIAYKNERYLWFGRATAQVDDLVNWVPARLSAFIIAFGVGLLDGFVAVKRSLNCAFRDSGLHQSPNAGWPEAAMAGAIGIALGGDRDYGDEKVAQAHINAAGRKVLVPSDISSALKVFTRGCYALWVLVLLMWLTV